MASQIAAEVTEAMIDKFDRPPEVEGHVMIGTASGDLHTASGRSSAPAPRRHQRRAPPRPRPHENDL
jgi:hypothetical protein